MMQAVEASLKRLRTDYIDLYWVHIWDQLTPVEEVMRGLDDLVRAAKVLYVGISDAPAWWIAQANTLAQLRGWAPFIGLQLEYRLIERTVERELIPMAKALGIGVTAWSPLANGVLTGKYHGRGSFEPGRLNSDMMKGFLPELKRTDRIVAAVKNASDETGRSMAQVALATLSAEQLKTLDEASRIELGFPYDFYTREMVRSICYGGLRDQILA
jgi:aryl-alcohol dehydrogenase-like predicted oxidoreductase